MKLIIELTKKEAQDMLGTRLRDTFGAGAMSGLEVSNVEWNAYANKVEVTLEKTEIPEPAPGS